MKILQIIPAPTDMVAAIGNRPGTEVLVCQVDYLALIEDEDEEGTFQEVRPFADGDDLTEEDFLGTYRGSVQVCPEHIRQRWHGQLLAERKVQLPIGNLRLVLKPKSGSATTGFIISRVRHD